MLNYGHNDGMMRDEDLAPFPRTEYAVRRNIQEYYAIISHLDAQVGRLIEALKKSGDPFDLAEVYPSIFGGLPLEDCP